MNTIQLRTVCRNIAKVFKDIHTAPKRMEAMGFVWLGAGRSRKAFRHPDIDGIVFKVECYRYGTDNLQERHVWRRMPAQERNRLATFYAMARVGKLGVDRVSVAAYEHIPKLAQCVDGSIFGGTVDVAEDWSDTIYKQARIHIGDIHGQNVGYRADGSWCILDYASSRTGD